ncbi:lamin-like protein [Juglans microcarpa x Juglans regia]|uniref:lamin-like protein n=1 Tax=Juglans microcarpa x Juglans regia TaxID=2249226 RepID=UPI001B7F16F0|nr:lamin-like protein [Juglans microcarpa x Juglans regia]
MEGLARKGGAFRVIMVVLMIMGWQTCALASLIRVGGVQGWNQNVNYTVWSRHQHIYVGDWLYFIFDKHYYNVLEVNKTSYENCNDQGFITNITRGGRDVFQVTEARPYYFLSSGGYCYHGMRVAVNVEDQAPVPSPAPASAQNENASPQMILISISTTLSIAFILVGLLLKP